MATYKNRNYLFRLFALLLIFMTIFCHISTVAYAEDESVSVQSVYESTNVLDNLEGSTIAGKKFNLRDYPHKENGQMQVISFIELCYSYYSTKQSDFGLYVYVYNPQDLVIDTNTNRNQIQMLIGDNVRPNTFELKFINYSTEGGYEGRFYKFKLVMDDSTKNMVLANLDNSTRIYTISGITLSVDKKAIEYQVGQKYQYTGYALGYGSALAENDSLSCTVSGFNDYLSLDVHSTFWRPQGTHSDGFTRDTIHSVYFAVPNKIIKEYGEMTAVHATWLNARTSPIFVTGNKDIYDAFKPFINQYVGGDSQKEYDKRLIDYTVIATKAPEGHKDLPQAAMAGYYAYNPYFHMDPGDNKFVKEYDYIVTNLSYLFYAENGNADTYTLPAEKLIGDTSKGSDGWFQTFTKQYGGELINDRYSAALFDIVDDKFTDINIKSNAEYNLQDKTVSDSLWNRLFDTTIKNENSYTLSAIQKVDVGDINSISDKTVFCNNYFISLNDYDSFTDFVQESNAKDETVYLFRYKQTEFISCEATEYVRDTEVYLVGGRYGTYKVIDTNAFFAQMWVQLDFDIIDLTFTKDNVPTIIPVVMSPMDIAADVEHPVNTQGEEPNWWAIILFVLILIIIFILILKFAPGLLTIIGKVILIPFKGLYLLFKGIGSIFRKMRNRKERQKKRKDNRNKSKKEKNKKNDTVDEDLSWLDDPALYDEDLDGFIDNK